MKAKVEELLNMINELKEEVRAVKKDMEILKESNRKLRIDLSFLERKSNSFFNH